MTDEQRKNGVVAASTGNHGAAIAYACKKLNIKCVIDVPEIAVPYKINNIQKHGIEVKIQGKDPGETEQIAREYARQNNKIYTPPYNDETIIAGQGTIGYELFEQLDNIDYIFVAANISLDTLKTVIY